MSKFKAGDRVRVLKTGACGANVTRGDEFEVYCRVVDSSVIVVKSGDRDIYLSDDCVEAVDPVLDYIKSTLLNLPGAEVFGSDFNNGRRAALQDMLRDVFGKRTVHAIILEEID